MPNYQIIEHIRHMQVGAIIKLPVSELYAFQRDLKEISSQVKLTSEWLNQAILQKYQKPIESLRIDAGKDTGIIHLEDDGFKVTSNVPKKVVWDQDKLSVIARRLRDSGSNVEEYVDVSYKVLESKYNSWPEHIRESFASARTLQTGKATIKISDGGDA